jgi:hypothetical protein
MHLRNLRLGVVALYFVLPIAVNVLTSLPQPLNTVTTFLALVFVPVLLSLRFLPKVSWHLRALLWTLFVLFLVGASGWYTSPFFFALYLIAIGIGFIYTPAVTVAFTASLVIVFALFADVKVEFDYLVLLSLLSVIPITIGLRRSFLVVQQQRKGILILEPEGKKSGITSLDAVLENRVNKISILLRQPVTYLKQGLALLEEGKLTEKEYPDVLTRMRRATDEVFTLMKEFERGVTKNVLVARRRSKPAEPAKEPKA